MLVVVVVELDQRVLLAILPLEVKVALAELAKSPVLEFTTQVAVVVEVIVLAVLVQYQAVLVAVDEVAVELLADFQALLTLVVVVAAEVIITLPPELVDQE
jgi:hypothetical protein